MESYRETAKKRARARREHLEARRGRAWEVARQAAALLVDEFGATKVAVFGSLLHPELFHGRSDVDLAVWGLAERDYFRAVSRLLSLGGDISVDLIEMENASDRLRNRILAEAKHL